MTIDEAIAREKEMAKQQNTKYDKCPTRIKYCCEMCFHNPKCNEVEEHHEQLVEWLEELKCYKNDNDFSGYADRLHKIAFNSGYNKAIDDFAGRLIRYVDCGHLCSPTEMRWSDLSVVEMVKKLAEQLKAGGENDL